MKNRFSSNGEQKAPNSSTNQNGAEEETCTRLVEVKNQMTQMTAMITEMKAFVIAMKGSYPVVSNPKVAPEIMDMKEDIRFKKTSKDEEEAKRLAKIEECLASQGYELQRFTILVKGGERIEWSLKEEKCQEMTMRKPYLGKKDKEPVRNMAMVSSPNVNQGLFPKQSNVPWRNSK
ncbi:hypothetical protein NL676_002065 [Syzygium grande]|nr:hypothetical protein NL676_002065 [Syzygium grande]